MSPRKYPPRLVLGPLTGRIYIATRYRDLGEGRIEAIEKYDVTSEFMSVKEESERLFDYKPIPAGEPGERRQ